MNYNGSIQSKLILASNKLISKYDNLLWIHTSQK